MNDPSRPRDPGSDIEGRHWTVFGVGIALYAIGFFLLGRNCPNLAPVFIVAGIVTMLGAFSA